MPVVLLLIAAGAAIAIASSRRAHHEAAAEHHVLAPFAVRFQLPGDPARDLFTSPFPGPAANAYEALRRQLVAHGSHGRLSLSVNTPTSSTELRVEIL